MPQVSEQGVYYFNESARQLMLPNLRPYPSEMRAMVSSHPLEHTRTRACTESRAYTESYIHLETHLTPYTLTNVHARILGHTHTDTHTHTHTYTHVYTH
jgi:hypothetical protein